MTKNIADTTSDTSSVYQSHIEEQLDKEEFIRPDLYVKKRDDSEELFDIRKVKRVFERAVDGYEDVCSYDEFVKALRVNLVPGIKTVDITRLMVKTAVDLITPLKSQWQYIAARILLEDLYKHASKTRKIGHSAIYSGDAYLPLMKDYIRANLYYKDFFEYYSEEEIKEAGDYLSQERDREYGYTTVLSLKNRYLLNPNGVIKELPQEMYMSIALFLAIPEEKNRLQWAFKIYDAISKQELSLPTPTLLNARTNWHQLASCFKLNIDDDLRSIYHAIENMAQISKYGGGIGVYLGNIRSKDAPIRGFNGASGGVNPWIKVINDTAVAVNQLGARMGAISVTLDVWHRDIYDFLDLQTETGDIRSKAFDIFPSISVPDLFMKRVEKGEDWTLFDPHEIEKVMGYRLQDSFGKEYEERYIECCNSTKLKLKKTVPAKELFVKFLRTVVETGMPYVFFRDAVNRANPNSHEGNIYSTQLCTEIAQNTSPSIFIAETVADGSVSLSYRPGDTVVCNLASINVAKVHTEKDMARVVPTAMRVLDNVITLNHYPVKEAELTAMKYRPVGLGYLGMAELMAKKKWKYGDSETLDKIDKLFSKYAYHTYKASMQLAKERGAYPLFKGSKHKIAGAWPNLAGDIKKYGLRFGYHTAPAPNTSTAGVVGTTAALLPIYKRFFVENNLSSPTVRVAPDLDLDNFEYYQEYTSLDMKKVIDFIATIQKWVDQSISFEWMINPNKISPKDLKDYYLHAWKKGIKTVYYVRSLSTEVDNVCESCSG